LFAKQDFIKHQIRGFPEDFPRKINTADKTARMVTSNDLLMLQGNAFVIGEKRIIVEFFP